MMKKNIFILFIILFSTLISKSQDDGDFRIGAYGQAITIGDHVIPQYGLMGEYFLSHNFSLNYKYGLGYNPDGETMGHINPSILGFCFLAYSTPNDLIWAFMIPEGVSYHVYPNNLIEIAPYINPLGSEINLYHYPSIVLSCSFGINLHIKPTEDLSFSPNMGAIIIYGNSEILPSFGFSINYNFHDF